VTARLLIAGLLLAHGLIHAGYLAPRPTATAGGPAWPFELGHSWLLGQLGAGSEVTRLVGVALVAATLAGFTLAALAAVGIGPVALWSGALTLGALASLGALVLFFHPWLVLGVAIDVFVLWAALVARWAPEGLAV
jgi:hypothetical protein